VVTSFLLYLAVVAYDLRTWDFLQFFSILFLYQFLYIPTVTQYCTKTWLHLSYSTWFENLRLPSVLFNIVSMPFPPFCSLLKSYCCWNFSNCVPLLSTAISVKTNLCAAFWMKLSSLSLIFYFSFEHDSICSLVLCVMLWFSPSLFFIFKTCN
jgi:hypothetical protein